MLEKAVLSQMQTFLNRNSILEVFQSGFREYHNTVSVLLKILNDVLFTVDSGNAAVVMLLELSAAVDTITFFLHSLSD